MWLSSTCSVISGATVAFFCILISVPAILSIVLVTFSVILGVLFCKAFRPVYQTENWWFWKELPEKEVFHEKESWDR